LALLGVESFPKVVVALENEFERIGLRVRSEISPTMDRFFRRMQSRDVHVYAARFTPRTPESESFLQAFLDKPPFFPLGLDSSIYSAADLVRNQLNAQERAVAVASVLRVVAKSHTLLPLHQFEFSGCVNPKWDGVEIPSTGFMDQEMAKLRLKN
jgi:MarR-like DNA-binding transcriptional regulator SgrR of sgrS sRNA